MNKYKQGVFFSHEFVGESSWNGYENNCLFAQEEAGKFLDVARPTGTDSVRDGRGVAVVDLDRDGRLDLVINNNASAPTVYLNRVRGGHYLALELRGTVSNRDAVGALVRLEAGGRTQVRHVEAGSGYASQAPTTLHFGLGEAERVDRVDITWPGGRVEHLTGAEASALGVDRTVWLEEPAAGSRTMIRTNDDGEG